MLKMGDTCECAPELLHLLNISCLFQKKKQSNTDGFGLRNDPTGRDYNLDTCRVRCEGTVKGGKKGNSSTFSV
jgi:hypothetical protein